MTAIHFLHVGKTGGTALRAALSGCQGLNFHPHPHGIKLADIPVGEKYLFNIRDPIARFVSGFLSRQRRGQPRYNSPWSIAEEQAFGRYETPNSLAMNLSSDDQTIKNAAQLAMHSIEHVNSSYYQWFASDAYLESRRADLVFIGLVDELDKDFERLKSLLNLPADVMLPADDVGAHRNGSHLSKGLEDEARENLMDWYKADIGFYKRCLDIRLQLLAAT